MKRVSIAIPVAVAVALGGAVACLYDAIRVKCTETLLTKVISPDGAWKAAEYERFCEGFLVTHIAAEVHLVSAHDPVRSAHILGVSANGADEDPSITWTAPRTLQVDVPSSVYLKVLTCEFDGVRVDIRLPPEDAANRVAWYHQLGHPDPDPGGVMARKCP